MNIFARNQCFGHVLYRSCIPLWRMRGLSLIKRLLSYIKFSGVHFGGLHGKLQKRLILFQRQLRLSLQIDIKKAAIDDDLIIRRPDYRAD